MRVGENQECPQSLYSPLPARMTMAKNFFIPKLDLREEKIQVPSPSLPLACSSRPHQRPHQCCPLGPHSCFPGLCDENLPPALWLLKEQSPGW